MAPTLQAQSAASAADPIPRDRSAALAAATASGCCARRVLTLNCGAVPWGRCDVPAQPHLSRCGSIYETNHAANEVDTSPVIAVAVVVSALLAALLALRAARRAADQSQLLPSEGTE